MVPNTDERIASIVRSLTNVILPALPDEASLAQEQVQLCIGHLQILRSQFDQTVDFEVQEIEDAKHLAKTCIESVVGNATTRHAITNLKTLLEPSHETKGRDHLNQINSAIEALIQSAFNDEPKTKDQVTSIILQHEKVRSQKDRHWCAPFGFDTL